MNIQGSLLIYFSIKSIIFKGVNIEERYQSVQTLHGDMDTQRTLKINIQ